MSVRVGRWPFALVGLPILPELSTCESAATLAERMPFADYRLRRFLVLNGLNLGAKLPTGHKVKVVSE